MTASGEGVAAMNSASESGERGEMLVRLRHAIWASQLLAEQMIDDEAVGQEARDLLAQLRALRRELDGWRARQLEIHPVDFDPIWRNQQWRS